ncbi:hypothetical protein L1987_87742 [Smallanthus sonchifolius]|nr:hypothetical protein L1987_87742 [Smallanthus sonchifolius]
MDPDGNLWKSLKLWRNWSFWRSGYERNFPVGSGFSWRVDGDGDGDGDGDDEGEEQVRMRLKRGVDLGKILGFMMWVLVYGDPSLVEEMAVVMVVEVDGGRMTHMQTLNAHIKGFLIFAEIKL